MTGPDPDEKSVDISEDVREMLGLFIEARQADLQRLERALAAGDFAAMRAVGHTFRGSSATFGFPETGKLGAALEEAAARGDREAVEALVPRLRASLPDPDLDSDPPQPP